ncbi:MAG TPA: hypothetical protein DGT21_03500, partial [Armatimonadetes bacterium]|nr:hypothetical protein [Armatimonadota bacterium]
GEGIGRVEPDDDPQDADGIRDIGVTVSIQVASKPGLTGRARWRGPGREGGAILRSTVAADDGDDRKHEGNEAQAVKMDHTHDTTPSGTARVRTCLGMGVAGAILLFVL